MGPVRSFRSAAGNGRSERGEESLIDSVECVPCGVCISAFFPLPGGLCLSRLAIVQSVFLFFFLAL